VERIPLPTNPSADSEDDATNRVSTPPGGLQPPTIERVTIIELTAEGYSRRDTELITYWSV